MSTIRGPKVPIGKILLDRGKITPDQLKQALAAQQKAPGAKIGKVLIDMGLVTERDILDAFSHQINVPVFDPSQTIPDSSVLKVIPDNLKQRYNVVPICRNNGKLVVAMQDPSNVFVLDDLRLITGFEIEALLATTEDLQLIQTGEFTHSSAVRETSQSANESDGPITSNAGQPKGSMSASSSATMTDIAGMLDALRRPDVPDGTAPAAADDEGAEVANDAPIIRMVNVLIQTAIKEGASDIHIEPERKNVRVRYRIDGVLYEMMSLPKFVHAPLISRFKIMADMNIAERRLPQDGRIHIRHDGRDFDMRVSALPTVYGEKIVMRILDQGSVLIGLESLGFTPDMRVELEHLVVQPNGMVLVTGPTGCGKTTTLYGILNRINSIEKNIVTIEDPVEYQLGGINQVSVNRKAGLNFPMAMRAFLRQDPDIIMVGEIRDLETAEIAVQASLTGHMVLTTLHTNDSPSTIMRLSDMGVEPFLISAAIIGVVAQRLARKLCDKCKEEVHLPPESLVRLGMKESEIGDSKFFKAVGCPYCNNRGYKGRVGVFELLTLNEELGEQIIRRAPLSEITQSALAGGMTTLLSDGLTKAKMGITSLEEVLRVVSSH